MSGRHRGERDGGQQPALRAGAQWQRRQAQADAASSAPPPPPKREQGRVATLREQFGFIQCCDRPGDLFFHLSVAPDGISIGDEVEFVVGHSDRSTRECASDVAVLPPGTIRFEAEIPGVFRGVVDRDLRAAQYGGGINRRNDRQGGRGRPVGRGDDGADGVIKVSGPALSKDAATAVEGEAAAPEAVAAAAFAGEMAAFGPTSLADQSASLRRGDEVEFRLVQHKGSGRKRAADVRVVRSSRQRQDEEQERALREAGAQRERGIVVRINGDYGFIRGADREEHLYFNVATAFADRSGWNGAAAADPAAASAVAAGAADVVAAAAKAGPTSPGKRCGDSNLAAAGAGAGAPSAGPSPAAKGSRAGPPPRLREGADVEFWVVDDTAKDGRPSLRALGVVVLPRGSVAKPGPLRARAYGTVTREPGYEKDHRRLGIAEFPPPPGGAGGGGTGGGAGRSRDRDRGGTLEASFSAKDVRTYTAPPEAPGGGGGGGEESGGHRLVLKGSDVPSLEVGDEVRADLYPQQQQQQRGQGGGGGGTYVVARNLTLVRLREPREEGVIVSLREGFGFIRCATREGDAFFRLRDVMCNRSGGGGSKRGDGGGGGESGDGGSTGSGGGGGGNAAGALVEGCEVRFNLTSSDRGDKLRATRVEVVPPGTVWTQHPVATGLAGTVAREARGAGAVGVIRLPEGTALPPEPPAAVVFPRLLTRLELLVDKDSEGEGGDSGGKGSGDYSGGRDGGDSAEKNEKAEKAGSNGGGSDIVSELCFCVGQLSARERRAAMAFARERGLGHATVKGSTWIWRAGAPVPALVAANSGGGDGCGDGGDGDGGGSGEKADGADSAGADAARTVATLAKDQTVCFGRGDNGGGDAPALGDHVSFDVVWDRPTQRLRAARVVVTAAAVVAAIPSGGGGGSGASRADGEWERDRDWVPTDVGRAGQGVVVQVQPERHFGFIETAATEERLFFHLSWVLPPDDGAAGAGGVKGGGKGGGGGLLHIVKGQEVSFVTAQRQGKTVAVQVRKLPKGTVTAASGLQEDSIPGIFRGIVTVPPRHAEDTPAPAGGGNASSGNAGGGGGGDGDDESGIHGMIAALPGPEELCAAAEAAADAAEATAAAATPAAADAAPAADGAGSPNDDVAAAGEKSGKAAAAAKAHARGGKAGRKPQGAAAAVPAFRLLPFMPNEVLAEGRADTGAGGSSGSGEVQRGDLVEFHVMRHRRKKTLRATAVRVVQKAKAPNGRAKVVDVEHSSGRVRLAAPQPVAATDEAALSPIGVPSAKAVRAAAAAVAAVTAVEAPFFLLKDMVGPVAPVRPGDEVDFLLPPQDGAVPDPGRVVGPVRVQDLANLRATRKGFNSALRTALQRSGKPSGAQTRMAHGPDGTRGFPPGWRSVPSLYAGKNRGGGGCGGAGEGGGGSSGGGDDAADGNGDKP